MGAVTSDTDKGKSPRYELISGGPESVDLDAVEPSLAELYHRAAGVEAEAALPSARTTLFNLIAYTRTESLAREAANLAGEIVAMRPCRAIVAGPEIACPPGVSAERTQGETACLLPHPQADVSVVCGITERGERRLCGEILLVHAGAGYVGGAVTPLLVPDVPVYIWVPTGIPSGDQDFDDVVLEADAAIVDSRRADDPASAMARALSFAGPEGHLCAIMDLAWVALLPWREAVASHFDARAPRENLNRVSGVIIEYAGLARGMYDCSAALLTAWLVDRLQLRVTQVVSEPFGAHLEAEQDGRGVSVDLIGTACGDGQPGPASVTIRCGQGEATVSYRTDNVPDSQPPAHTIARALDMPKRDAIYESAAGTACDLLRLAGNRG